MTAVLTVLAAALVVAAALAAVLVPLLRPGRGAAAGGAASAAGDPGGLAAELTRARDAKRAVLEDLLALEADYRTGVLSEADYLELRRQDEARALALIARVDELCGAVGDAHPAEPGVAPATAEGAPPAAPGAAPDEARRWLTPPVFAGLAAVLLAAGVGAGYLAAVRTGPDPVAQAAGGAGPGAMPGQVMAMIQEYRARLEKDPRDVEALLAMADLNLQRQDVGQAVDYYKRAIDADPGNPEALARLGMILGEAGHYPESVATLDRALERDPNHLEALWWKGQVQLFGLKDYRAAAATWERLATLLPPGPDQDRARQALAQARAAAAPAAPAAPAGAPAGPPR